MRSWVRDVAGSKGAASAIERHFSKEKFCKVLRDFIRAQEGLRLSARKEQAQAPSQP
jgi:hypothetical protein